ncbi:MAG: phage tail tape measure protein [Lachnospiraceae bacterium]|nr:phage tail tape measure protein [Lachnospiraceae bacterium]
MELFKLFGTIVVKNTEANNAIDVTADKAQSFSQRLSDKFTDVGAKATNLGTKLSLGLTTPIALIGTKAIQATADFEYAMSEVGAISGATGDDLAALENKAKEMGETTKFSASESAEALKYMAMAGWKTSDMLDGLEGIMNLAAASGEDLGTTSDIVTDALTAFGMTASDSGHFADILATASSNANTNVSMMGETFKYVAPVAGALGYSAEDTAEAIGLMANAGIKSSQAGTSLRSILSNLQGEVKFAGAQFGEMTIQTTNTDGSMRSLGEILGDCRTAFSMMSESEKASNAEMVVGKEAMSGFLAIMNAAPSDIDKLNNAIGNCDGSAKNMADTMNNNLSGQITLLKSQLEGLAIQFVTLIMPYLKQGVEWLSKVCEWIAGLDDGTKKMIITVGGIVAAAGPVLIFLGKVSSGIGSIIKVGGLLIGGIGKLSPAISGIMGIGGKLVGGIGGLIGKVTGGGGLIAALGAIPAPVWIVIGIFAALVTAGVLIYKNWDEIKEWAGKTWGKIKEIVGGAVDGIRNFFSGVIDFVKDNWQGLALLLVNPFVGGFKLLYDNCDSFRNFVDNFLGNLKEGFQNFVSNVSEKAGELKDKVVNKAKELKDGAVEKFQELKEKATEKVEALKESASNKFSQLKDSATEKVNSLKEKAVSKFQELKDKASEKIASLKEKGVAGFKALKSGALEKFDNLRNGVSEKLDAVKNFVFNTVQKLKDFFKFDWSLPKIKLPHFSISGEFSLSPPSIPHIGVEWYKKAMDKPIVMDKPTAFGISPSGKVMAGGEAGSEVVSGTQTLMDMISAAVAENNGQLYEVLNRLYNLMAEYLPMLANMQVVLDSGMLVGELAQPMNEELGRITHMRGRRN